MDEDKKKQIAVLGGLAVVFLLVQIIVNPFGIGGGGGEVAPPSPGGAGVPAAPGVPTVPGAPTVPGGTPPDSGDMMASGGFPGGPGGGMPGAAAPGMDPTAMPSAVPAGPRESGPSQLPGRVDPMAPLNPPITLVAARQPWTGTSLAGGLPPLSYANVMPRVPQPPPPPRFANAIPPVVESRELRLSGILLNGSLYVILEILSTDGTSLPRGYVVKPGDEVEGIRVMKIERYRENDQLVTRATVRTPDRQEKHVYLRAGAPDPAAQGGDPSGGGGAGMPGGPGGGGAVGS